MFINLFESGVEFFFLISGQLAEAQIGLITINFKIFPVQFLEYTLSSFSVS